MKTLTKITTTAAIVGSVAMFSMPASAVPTEEECKANFATADMNDDDRLEGDETAPYSEVMTKVDTNNDGMISWNEYNVVCKQGLFDDIEEEGA